MQLVVDSKPSRSLSAECENCGQLLTGPFCSNCGQLYLAGGPTFRSVFREVWDETFKVDGKLLSSFRLLLFAPGKLTQEYLSGRRTKYVTPFKLYLTCSAIYAAIANIPYFNHQIVQNSQFKATSSSSELTPTQLQSLVTRSVQEFYGNISTIFIVAVPLTGILVWFLFLGLKRPLFHHLITTLHLWGTIFLILAGLTVVQVRLPFMVLLTPTSTIYAALTFRKLYRVSWVASITKGFILSIASVVFIASVLIEILVVHVIQLPH